MYTEIVLWFCIIGFVFNVPIVQEPSVEQISENPDEVPQMDVLSELKSNTVKVNRTVNYETLGGGFEGDMIFPPGFDPKNPASQSSKGVAVFGPRRWPNNVIPYDMSAITNTQHRNLIVTAMNTLMYAVGQPITGKTSRKACISFRPRQKSDRVYLKIIYGSGCSSTVGYYSNMLGTMTLNNPGCFYTGIIQHELLHALGFYHEQSRPDRDSYITINYANIKRGMEYNFDKFAWGRTVQNQNTPYDTGSIMHYGAYDFSANNRPTITSKRSTSVLGQREELSAIDIAEVRDYYQC